MFGRTSLPGDVGFEAKMHLMWEPMSWGKSRPLRVAGDADS